MPGRLIAGFLGVAFLVLSLVSFVAIPESEETPDPSAEAVAVLPAPSPTSPVCGTTIEWREVEAGFSWDRVENASTYTVEVDWFRCRAVDGWFTEAGQPWHIREGRGLRSPIYSSDTVPRLLYEQGGLAIRWRVWAVGQEGDAGTKSEWCQIAFFGTRPDA